jgi:hypothetical protein
MPSRSPASVKALEDLGRVRLSPNFFMRDFLHSEIASFFRLQNIPDDPELAIDVGRQLCTQLLEPLQARFGRLAIRSAYRSCAVNQLGNEKRLNCASNEKNYAAHIWDRLDANGKKGATACVVVPVFADYLAGGGDWRAMAWWIHDHLPYSYLCFFANLGAFNIQWHEAPERTVDSYLAPKGTLTKPGMTNHTGRHDELYADFLSTPLGEVV